MHLIDWIVMLAVLLGIVGYGIYKTRNVNSVKSYLLGDKDLKWWTIGLSVMATQASAITFLSTPGQAYDDGMRFAQFYFGLPVAMVILCIFVLPLYYKLNVYTAYEYLEGRFGRRTRSLTAILFLMSRGLAAGITIYAPAIILSNIMDWNLSLTILLTGMIVIFYTVSGGTKAVSITQKQQMIVILSGMFIAAGILVHQLPEAVSFGDAVGVAGAMGKLNVVDFEFDLSERYNFWSGMIGGVFLFLSYFGTDQSQVQRYLSGKSLTESRLGLLFNGIVKVPMQFLVLFVGILVFVFFQFNQPPIHYNQANLNALENTEYAIQLEDYQSQQDALFAEKQIALRGLISAIDSENEAAIESARVDVLNYHQQDKDLRQEVRTLIQQSNPDAETKDTDYVFITFITNYLPIGLIGLLLAVIFSAAMSSTSSELNALATTTVIDLYKRNQKTEKSDEHYFNASKGFTIMWGLLALSFAFFASLFDNLIEAVNIVGSVFYGVILGIFLVAFFMGELSQKSKTLGAITGAIIGAVVLGAINGQLQVFEAVVGGIIGGIVGWHVIKYFFRAVGGTAVFIAAIITEIIVISVYFLNEAGYVNIAYLWLNLIGCVLLILLSFFIQKLRRSTLDA